MKNIKIILMICITSVLFYACDTTNESGYVPAVYTSPATFTITEDATATADNSFVFTYTPSSTGKAYYVVVPAGTAAPSATQVHRGGDSFQQSGSFNVDGSTSVNVTVDSNVYGAYTYDVYAIHKSTDNFISETVTKLSVVTPDTAAPMFLRDDSNPAFTAAGISPFAAVTLTFSEPVFYQGGNISFKAFDGGSGMGREIIVNSASALSKSGASIKVNTHGTFAQGDFIIVTWADGTFKDKAGKNVAALSGFSHYFSTRAFTAPEAAALMVGTYNYATVFYGGFLEGFYTNNAPLFLPDTGQFELKLDPSDATGRTLLGINLYSTLPNYGFPHPANLKIKFGAGGELAILDTEQSADSFETFNGGFVSNWKHYVASITTPLPGFYDVEAGTINHWVSVVVASTGGAYDDMDYNYTRIGNFAKPSKEDLDKRNALIKKKDDQHKTYRKISYNNTKVNK